MDKQKKYTHLIENCNSLIKEYTDLTLERCTGDTISIAYWRLREGKGLQTYTDKNNLDTWSRIVTEVRRVFASPAPLPAELHDDLYKFRQEKLDKMEEYKDWLAYGSKPSYLYEVLSVDGDDIDVHAIATNFALNEICTASGFSTIQVEAELQEQGLDPNPKSGTSKDYVKAYKEALRDFWQTSSQTIKPIENRIYVEILPLWQSAMKMAEENPKIQAHSKFMDLLTLQGYSYEYPKADKVYHIRTDMDHRSSVGAKINSTLNWIHQVDDKSANHTAIYDANFQTIEEFKAWKADEKQRRTDKSYKSDSEECFRIVMDAVRNIKIPVFNPKEMGR